jgi:polyferredoxin
MEMVFRKVEYLIEGDGNDQRKLNAAPWNTGKILKKTLKLGIFFLISVLVANTFLAYIIGADKVSQIASEPLGQHLGGFAAMLLFSGAFFVVFAILREQVCTTICPYGRLQGVMLVKDTIVVAYDFGRGEPRGRTRKSENKVRKSDPISKIQQWVSNAPATARYVKDVEPEFGSQVEVLGDCVDCKLCIQVCPTGIDIRNGTQLECINCTACIDACDEVMEKIHLPKGLIRYDSMSGIETGKRKLVTPRSVGYTAVLLLLVGFQIFLFSRRTDVEVLLLRTPGMLYQKVDDTHLSNLYNYEVINKTRNEFQPEFRLLTPGGKIKVVGIVPVVKGNEVLKGSLFIEMDKANLTSRKTELVIEVFSGGKMLDRVKTNFMGPVK